ncbi:MAG: hypothetical protein ACO209_05730 [Aquirufa sp.]
MRLILCLVFIGLFSCARPSVPSTSVAPKTSVDKIVKVLPKSLQVLNTQEIFGDEVLLVGAIGIVERDKITPVQVFSSYLGKVKKDQVIRIDTINPVSVRLKPGQKASFQLSLFELEDYQPTKKWLNRFNAVSGVFALPLAITSAENPVAWFLWGMKAGSLGVDWVSELDLKDLLGVSETQWDYESARSSTRTGKWVGGRSRIDDFEYVYSIQIKVD